jgi:chloramphenicol 3-O phosphotransferase
VSFTLRAPRVAVIAMGQMRHRHRKGVAVVIQVILLNGGSSSGKTSIAACLQDMLPSPWLHLGVDTLLDAMPSALLTSADGIAFGADGSVHPGPAFRQVEAAWMQGIATMARAGARIILDEVFLSGALARDRWREALDGVAVLWVGVRCDPAVATIRERGRADRIVGMAASQAHLVHTGMAYDVEVDTSETSAAECARHIAQLVDD